MMVNFSCQLDWIVGCPDVWLDVISGYFCENISEIFAFDCNAEWRISVPVYII